MGRKELYREEVGNFYFTIEPFSSESRLFRANFYKENENGVLESADESLSWDECEIIIMQARMRLNQLFTEECEQLDWEIYIMGGLT
jgi:hypothetical protein